MSSRYERKIQRLEDELHGGQPIKINRDKCEDTGKVIFHSKHEARMSLTGGMKGKSIRVYTCPFCSKLHMTKSWKTNIDSRREKE